MTGIHDVLTQIGYTQLRDFGKEYRTTPLYRPSDNNTSLAIDKHTGKWYDFSERVGGSLEMLIERTLQKPISEDLKQKLSSGTFIEVESVIELPYAKTFDKGLLVKLTKDHSYWNTRGISTLTVARFNGGITDNGRMAHRYVFPIFNDTGELVGFSGRRLHINSISPKWKHLGAKSFWVYPRKHSEATILKHKKVILVESIGDMLALYEAGIENVLVAFGVEISPKIIEYMLSLDIHMIYIGFNNDQDNNLVGNRAAVDGKLKLSSYFDNDQIRLAIPSQKNDFGEMTFEEIQLWKTQNQI